MSTQKNLKKMACVVLSTFVITALTLSNAFATSCLYVKSGEVRSIEVKTENDIQNVGNADIVAIDKELLNNAIINDVKEILDNGTVLVIDKVKEDEVAKMADSLEIDFEPEEKSARQETIGAYLSVNEEGNYMISEIVAEIMKKKTEEGIEADSNVKGLLDEIRSKESIDTTELYKQIEAEKVSETKLKDVSDKELAHLQSAAGLVTKAFADKTVTYYLYSSATATNHTSYTKADPCVKLATVQISLYAMKLKTSGIYTYDAFASDVSVAPNKKNLDVKEYHAKMATEQNSRYQTLDSSQFSNNSKVTFGITLGGSIDKNAVGSVSYSYTYEPKGQNIDNHTGYTYTQWWNAKPINPNKMESYKISPSITTKIKDGTTKTSKVKAVCSYINLHEILTAGWITDVDKSVTISFKNHKQV